MQAVFGVPNILLIGSISILFKLSIPPSLVPVKSRMVYLSGASLLRLSWKKGH